MRRPLPFVHTGKYHKEKRITQPPLGINLYKKIESHSPSDSRMKIKSNLPHKELHEVLLSTLMELLESFSLMPQVGF